MTDKIHKAAVRAAIILVWQPDAVVENAIEQAIRTEFADVDLSELLPCVGTSHDQFCPAYYRPAVALAIEAARAEGYAQGREQA